MIGGVEKIFAAVGRHRPVVVLAASVDSVKRLFVKKANHSVAVGNRFHNGHYDLIVIYRFVRGGVNACKFVLCGGNFVMLGFCVNAELPEFLVEIGHIIPYALFDFSEVMVFKLLTFWRVRTEKRSAASREVEPFFVYFFIHKEIFLFRADRRNNLFGLVVAEKS